MTDTKELLNRTVSGDLEENIRCIRELLDRSIDLVQRDFVYHDRQDLSAVCFYIDGLVNAQILDTSVFTPLIIESAKIRGLQERHVDGNLADHVIRHVLTDSSIHVVETFDLVMDALLSGDSLLFLDRCDRALVIATRGWQARSVEEPSTEPVVRGPRDGFVESIRMNTALMRRRIRDPMLRIEAMKIGTRTRTDVNIAYIRGIVKEGLVDEVRRRLEGIEIDGVLESGYIEELIEDAPFSPFTTVQSTERPDRVASSLLEGRVAIFVDNTPFVLVMPTSFWQFLQASDDYYSRYWSGSFFRFVRYIGFFISLTLPSLYVMLVSFHQEMIPTALALSIAAGRESVPFPAIFEGLIMEMSFELMREAGLRMPRPVGQAVSIVGSLVIGQAAVQAGLVSPAMVIVVAITGISSFAIPNYAASFAIRMLRFPLLFASGYLGLLGFSAVFSMLVVHALSLRSFGESYLSPATPFSPSDQKDMIVRLPWWKMDKRPAFAADQRRLGENQRPQPPKNRQAEQTQQAEKSGEKSAEKSGEQEQAERPEEKEGKRKSERPWRNRNRET